MSARRLAVALVAASSMAAIGAFAAGATIESSTLASGSDAVTGCDTTPTWQYAFTKDADGMVDQVVVTEIDPGCVNGALSLAITPGPAQGSATVTGCTAQACAATVVLNMPLIPSAVDNVSAVIVGP